MHLGPQDLKSFSLCAWWNHGHGFYVGYSFFCCGGLLRRPSEGFLTGTAGGGNPRSAHMKTKTCQGRVRGDGDTKIKPMG